MWCNLLSNGMLSNRISESSSGEKKLCEQSQWITIHYVNISFESSSNWTEAMIRMKILIGEESVANIELLFICLGRGPDNFLFYNGMIFIWSLHHFYLFCNEGKFILFRF